MLKQAPFNQQVKCRVITDKIRDGAENLLVRCGFTQRILLPVIDVYGSTHLQGRIIGEVSSRCSRSHQGRNSAFGSILKLPKIARSQDLDEEEKAVLVTAEQVWHAWSELKY